MLNDIWVYKKTSRIMLALLLIAVVMLSTQNWQLGLLLFIIIAGCIVYIKRCDFYQEKNCPGTWTICPPAYRQARCMP